MKVPIVSGRRALAFAGEPRDFAGAFGEGLQIGGSDDAVRLSISSDEEISDSELAESGVRYDGALPSLLRTVRELSKRINDLSKAPADGVSGAQTEARAKEAEALRGQLNEIVNGDSVRSLNELLTGVGSALSSGASPDAVARALLSQGTSLGSNFLGLVRSGATSNLSQVSSFIASLAGADTSGDLTALADGARRAERNLVTAPGLKASAVIGATAATKTEITPLEAIETKFAAGGDLALSIHGYGSRDLIKAAATGAISDVSLISQISISAPPSDEEKEKEEELRRGEHNSGGELDLTV